MTREEQARALAVEVFENYDWRWDYVDGGEFLAVFLDFIMKKTYWIHLPGDPPVVYKDESIP